MLFETVVIFGHLFLHHLCTWLCRAGLPDHTRYPVDERRQEESSKAAELQARQEKLDALRKLMEEDGINPEELLGSFQAKSTATKKSRGPRPAKYSFTDENGETKTWTGQGRTPKALAEQIAAGKSLDDFLI
ncbi:H-NS family nucleoid-associated regulatory protein [Salmonella enterica]|uniref:H-NS family nucleoid-associated regulatory protein n=1 Tax=Salmonella enterica TaxID=28901 RepID=UPI00215707BA|nr:H-NS family nucleoid-associated regulatory protein [Salmonella enterica]